MSTVTLNLPRSAFAFSGSLAVVGETDGDGPTRVEIVARSALPVEHIAFMRPEDTRVPRVVHDNATFHANPRIAVDWEHERIPIGYADRVWTDDAGNLRTSAVLIPHDPRDMAARVIAWARDGIPLEASVFWDYMPDGSTRLEWHESAVTVNGRLHEASFERPLVVIRNWRYASCAVCQHGQDPNTSIHVFSHDAQAVVPLALHLPEESPMPDDTPPTPPTEKPKNDPPADAPKVPAELAALVEGWDELPEEVRNAILAQIPKDPEKDGEDPAPNPAPSAEGDARQAFAAFVKEFGKDRAAEYFAAGLDLAAARAKQAEWMRGEIDRLNKDLAVAKAAAGDADVQPHFTDGGKPPAAAKGFAAAGTAALAKYAASLNL